MLWTFLMLNNLNWNFFSCFFHGHRVEQTTLLNATSKLNPLLLLEKSLFEMSHHLRDHSRHRSFRCPCGHGRGRKKMLQSEFELTEELCYLLIQQQEKQQCNEVRSARLGSHQAIFN